MCQSGAVALSLDNVDIAHVIKTVPRRIVVIGNISTQRLLMNPRSEIEKETIKLIETIKGARNFCIAPGCDLAPQTPLENIISFVKIAKEHRRNP
jgi:uroporphyrinogen-III decarboxylase